MLTKGFFRGNTALQRVLRSCEGLSIPSDDYDGVTRSQRVLRALNPFRGFYKSTEVIPLPREFSEGIGPIRGFSGGISLPESSEG